MGPGGSLRRLTAIALITVLVMVILLGWWLPVRQSAGWLVGYVSGFGYWAALVYVLICLPVLVLGLPLTPVLIVTGVLFGVWPGFVVGYMLVVGAAASGYWLARLGGLHHRRADEREGRWQRIRAELSAQDTTFVALFRLVPTLPYGATNVLLASWRIDFGRFLLGSVIGMTPGIVLNVYIGWVGGITLTSDRSFTELPPSMLLLLALNLTAMIVITFLMWHRFRRALTSD